MTRQRVALILAAVGVAAALSRQRVACYLRGNHDPVRRFLGFFQCRRCAKKGADLSAFGLFDDGFVRGRR